ncbi:MAG: hypothetical protein A2V93_01645 [Ignavibacteria bacterium RBG_16_34_14]|nr:MAG: hypothetical protein A2V93_01645 [Ignavibacteria bacterium RBG_16_34_14]
MNKAELIKNIAGSLSIPESEQKLFFEMLLKRSAEMLNPGESLTVSGLGKFEYRKSFNENENDLIVFVTNDNEEIPFDIPEKEEESSLNKSVDSYFSISIGKPIIPLKGSDQNEFFIPHSGDELKRLLELKVEKFIEQASKTETEEQETSDIADIRFSFLNWKRSTDLNEEINQIEQRLDESFVSEVSETEKSEDKIENEIESEYLKKDETVKIENKTLVEEKTKETGIPEDVEEELMDEEIKANEELISGSPEDEEELLESTEEWVEDLIKTENAGEEILEKTRMTTGDEFTSSIPENKDEEVPSYRNEKEKINEDDDLSAISEAFKYAEDKKARLESYKKRSYGGFIFVAVIIFATAAVIYFSFYFNDSEKTDLTQQTAELKKFKTVIERSYDIPVSYPYHGGMFAGIYDAINDDILTPIIVENQSSEQNTKIASNSIRSVLPSNRVKDYIYQYIDGTFAVQVSSWKSKTVALSETQKLLDKGYNAFIEETGLSGVTYYRVRVGGFKSLTEAEDFSRK